MSFSSQICGGHHRGHHRGHHSGTTWAPLGHHVFVGNGKCSFKCSCFPGIASRAHVACSIAKAHSSTSMFGTLSPFCSISHQRLTPRHPSVSSVRARLTQNRSGRLCASWPAGWLACWLAGWLNPGQHTSLDVTTCQPLALPDPDAK